MPTINLTQEEAEALHTYTKTSLDSDDSFDDTREQLVSACQKLKDSTR